MSSTAEGELFSAECDDRLLSHREGKRALCVLARPTCGCFLYSTGVYSGAAQLPPALLSSTPHTPNV